MNNPFPGQGNESIANLSQKSDCLLLGKGVLGFEILLKIWVAKLLNDVVVVGALHDIIDLDDVFGFEELQDLYLGEKGRF